jgi:nucleotide-binding universal stress UspA family protein
MNANPDPPPFVVGIDGSVGSRYALDWAIEDATFRHAPLELVHAWRPMFRTDAGHGQTDASIVSLAHSDSLLAAALGHAQVTAPSLAISGHLMEGRPSAVLLEAAAGGRVLVVGSRGLGGYRDLQLGSVGLHAVVHSSGSVVIVRGQLRRKGPVVVGVDGSAGSALALSVAFEEASVRNCPLLIVWALYVHSTEEGVPDYARALAGLKAFADDALHKFVAAASLRHPDVAVEMSSPVGYPAEVLAKASVTGRLLVVGARGSGGFSGMRLGSIAHAVAHQSSSPVMVVRGATP